MSQELAFKSIARKMGDECFRKNAIFGGNQTQALSHCSQMS